MRATPSGTRSYRLAAVVLVALTAAACANQKPDDAEPSLYGYEEPNDPIEPVNRAVFKFNRGIDTVLLKPAAQAYDQVPAEFRAIIANFLQHISTPVVLANDIMQGEWHRAEATATRLFVNTAVLGLGDLVPERAPYHSEDFGQTMAVHGVDDGFYLVLPLFGPSSARDGVGMAVDIFLTPWTYADNTTTFSLATTGLDGVRKRHAALGKLDALERDAVDFYARMRSLYYQRRRSNIDNQPSAEPAVAVNRADRERFGGEDTETRP